MDPFFLHSLNLPLILSLAWLFILVVRFTIRSSWWEFSSACASLILTNDKLCNSSILAIWSLILRINSLTPSTWSIGVMSELLPIKDPDILVHTYLIEKAFGGSQRIPTHLRWRRGHFVLIAIFRFGISITARGLLIGRWWRYRRLSMGVVIAIALEAGTSWRSWGTLVCGRNGWRQIVVFIT